MDRYNEDAWLHKEHVYLEEAQDLTLATDGQNESPGFGRGPSCPSHTLQRQISLISHFKQSRKQFQLKERPHLIQQI